MEKREVEELKDRVLCAAVLESAGFAVDLKESTRGAVKYRSGAAIIIVIHDGKGWFDPLSDAKGDVFRLVGHLDSVGFAKSLERVAELIGFVHTEPAWRLPASDLDNDITVAERWERRRPPWPGSATWRYLHSERDLPEPVIRAAALQDHLREGPRGSMWAAHSDDRGIVTGWEERGPEWRGFATGGAKRLFRFGPPDAWRFCVTEAAIDAMSLAEMEGLRADSLYLSTGGGWAPATAMAIRALAAREPSKLVAATDNNAQGEIYAGRLRAIADEVGCGFDRLRPTEEDWNQDLQARKERDRGTGLGRMARLPRARRPRQG